MKSLSAYLVLVAAIALERLFELYLARRNARRAFARGAFEVGRGHYRVMTVFHTLFLCACAAEAILLRRPFPGPIAYLAIGGVIAAQILRYSAVAALGRRWNTRIIVTPDTLPVVRGPYRFVRHPNYVAVAIEMAALPMVRGCWLTAVAFSLGNAALMAVRITAEEQALGAVYQQIFSTRPRFLPKFR
jgi:methyltransferase